MEIIEPEHKKLNLGCGFKKLLDHWNIDVEKKCNPDQVIDLEQFPWPFEDNYFEHITADNILEHLGQTPSVFTQVMKEMYRVSADQATWFIIFPHHRCDIFYDDYTHVRPLTSKTFKMFDQQANFESINRKLSDSTFGLYHDIDIEVLDINHNLTGYFLDKLSEGMVGSKELNIQMNTMSNVCETVSLHVKVHKPGRYANWYHNNNKND